MSELNDVMDGMESLMYDIREDFPNVTKTKAAAARVRKATLALEKQFKRFRALSVAHHKK